MVCLMYDKNRLVEFKVKEEVKTVEPDLHIYSAIHW